MYGGYCGSEGEVMVIIEKPSNNCGRDGVIFRSGSDGLVKKLLYKYPPEEKIEWERGLLKLEVQSRIRKVDS